MYHKWQSYVIWSPWYGAWRTELFVILGHFLHLKSLTTWKIKISWNEKNAWRYYHFIHVHHRWRSYDVWFLRYRAWRTVFFVILGYFLHFYPKKSKFWKTERSAWIYHHFTYVYQKLSSDNVQFLRYGARRTDWRKKWHIEVGVRPKNQAINMKGKVQLANLE